MATIKQVDGKLRDTLTQLGYEVIDAEKPKKIGKNHPDPNGVRYQIVSLDDLNKGYYLLSYELDDEIDSPKPFRDFDFLQAIKIEGHSLSCVVDPKLCR